MSEEAKELLHQVSQMILSGTPDIQIEEQIDLYIERWCGQPIKRGHDYYIIDSIARELRKIYAYTELEAYQILSEHCEYGVVAMTDKELQLHIKDGWRLEE